MIKKIIIVIFTISILLIPSIHAKNANIDSEIKDRYSGHIFIKQIFSPQLKKEYDKDHSGYLDFSEFLKLLDENMMKLNFTPAGNYFLIFHNLTIDGRNPMVNLKGIHKYENYSFPMPVNTSSYYAISFNFTFYLNGTYDHTLKISLPDVSGMFSIALPKNDTILQSNLIDPIIEKNKIKGRFDNSIIIKFREEYYYWMSIYVYSFLAALIGVFIFIAYKFRGGRVKGIKLLIRSTLRNLFALFIVLTILFYILWVLGPPPQVRAGGISDIIMRFYIIKYYHLDRPWYDQYLNWWHLILTGGITKGVNWGTQPIDLKNAIIVSLTIFILTTVITYFSSLYLAIRKKSPRSLDIYAAIFLALYSIPTFYASLVILQTFQNWPLLYDALVSPTNGWQEGIRIIIASLILSLLTIARPYLIAHSIANREYMEPYVKTFQAVGLTPKRIKKFIKKSTMIPTMTDLVLNFGWILTAQVFLEVIFHIKGIGLILFKGTINGNPFQIQIAIIYFSLVMIAASIFSDIVIYFLDPRVRR